MKRKTIGVIGLVGLVSSGCVGVRPVSRDEFASNLFARGAFKIGGVLVESSIERQRRWDEDTREIFERRDNSLQNPVYPVLKGTIETRLELISDPEDAEVYIIRDVNSMEVGNKIGNTPFQYSIIDYDAEVFSNGRGNLIGRTNMPSTTVRDVKMDARSVNSDVKMIHSGVMRFNFLFKKEGYIDAIGYIDFNAPYDNGILRCVSASYDASKVNGEVTHYPLGKIELSLVKE